MIYDLPVYDDVNAYTVLLKAAASCRTSKASPPQTLCGARRDDGVPRNGLPPKILAEKALGHELLNVIDALVLRALKILEFDADGLICLVELAGALARIPLRP